MERFHMGAWGMACVLFFSTLCSSIQAAPQEHKTLRFGLVEHELFARPGDMDMHSEHSGLFVDAIALIMSHLRSVEYDITIFKHNDDMLKALNMGKVDTILYNQPNTLLSDSTLMYSNPVMISTLNLIYKLSLTESLHAVWSYLIDPEFFFSFSLFLMVVLCFGLCFYLFENKHHPEFKNKHLFEKIALGLYWSLGIGTAAGSDIQPASVRGRALAGLYFILSVFMISNISATFSSLLTVEQLQQSKDFELKNLKHFVVGTYKNSIGSLYLKTNRIIPTSLNTPEESIKFLEKPGHLMLLSELDTHYFLKKTHSKRYRAKTLYGAHIYYSFIYREGYQLAGELDNAIMQATLSYAMLTLTRSYMDLIH